MDGCEEVAGRPRRSDEDRTLVCERDETSRRRVMGEEGRRCVHDGGTAIWRSEAEEVRRKHDVVHSHIEGRGPDIQAE